MQYERKALSCGFLIFSKKNPNLMLACQPHGRQDMLGNFDIPKGHAEVGETYIQAAKRELREETGLILTDEPIWDCGTFQYLQNKDLHLYITIVDVNLNELHCDSMFEFHGKMVPEVIGYKWVDDLKYYYKSLQPILNESINHWEKGYYEKVN